MSVQISNFKWATKMDKDGKVKPFTNLLNSYSAPEFYKKDPYDGFKSDIWSIGVVLFQMVTHGNLPYDITKESIEK